VANAGVRGRPIEPLVLSAQERAYLESGGGGGGPTNPIPNGGANGGLFSSPTGGAGTNANPPGNLLSLGGASGGSLFVPVSPR
jgi:hypothetical protein